MLDQTPAEDAAVEAALVVNVSEAIIAISADAIISIDESNRIIQYNSGAAEIFGYSRSEILGAPIDTLIPQRFRATHPAQIAAFAASPVVARRMGERRQISALRKNGEEFPAEASISKTHVDGRWIFTVALRDITDRVRVQRAQRFLAEATALLNGTLNAERTLESIASLSLPTLGDWCVVFLPGEGTSFRRALAVHTTADRMEDMQALTQIPFLPTRLHPLLPALQHGETVLVEDFDEAVMNAWTQNAIHREIMMRLDPASMLAVPLKARDRQLGAICYFIDRGTTRKYDADDQSLAEELARRAGMALDNARLYAVAQDAVGARDDVLAVVSHDLGNPLAAIRLSSTVLSRVLGRVPGIDAETIQQVDNIRLSVVQMERLIKDLLDIKRIDAGFLSLEMETLSVDGLLDDVVDSFRGLALARGINLVRLPFDGPVNVKADHERIVQVFSNLVGNALKFTATGESVTISAAANEHTIAFTIADSGPGIPHEHLPHIFDRFWQARRSGRQSIGLGLAIVKGIVDAHGGTIRVTSELGVGSAFTFELPVSM